MPVGLTATLSGALNCPLLEPAVRAADRALVDAGGVEDLHSLIASIRNVNDAGRAARNAARTKELVVAGAIDARGADRALVDAGGVENLYSLIALYL